MAPLKVKEEIGIPDIVVNNAGSFYMQVDQIKGLMQVDQPFLEFYFECFCRYFVFNFRLP